MVSMCFKYVALDSEEKVALFLKNLKSFCPVTNLHNQFYSYRDISSDTSFFKDILPSSTIITYPLRLQSHVQSHLNLKIFIFLELFICCSLQGCTLHLLRCCRIQHAKRNLRHKAHFLDNKGDAIQGLQYYVAMTSAEKNQIVFSPTWPSEASKNLFTKILETLGINREKYSMVNITSCLMNLENIFSKPELFQERRKTTLVRKAHMHFTVFPAR